MKYLNSLVFLSMMILVAGCQKSEKLQPKKEKHKQTAQHKKTHVVKKQGPTMLQTKKSAAAHKLALNDAMDQAVTPSKKVSTQKANNKNVSVAKKVASKKSSTIN